MLTIFQEQASECMIRDDRVYVVDEIQKTNRERKDKGTFDGLLQNGWLGDKKGRAAIIL